MNTRNQIEEVLDIDTTILLLGEAKALFYKLANREGMPQGLLVAAHRRWIRRLRRVYEAIAQRYGVGGGLAA